jgi:hypothetical protein
MTAKKIIAIFLIFMGALIGWMILGAANKARTDTNFYQLKSEVASLYGGDLVFRTPLCYEKREVSLVEKQDGVEVERTIFQPVNSEILESNVLIEVFLDQRKRGNLWFPTFRTRFQGDYLFKADPGEGNYFIYSVLESSDSIYKNIHLEVNGVGQENLIPLIRRQEFAVTPDEEGFIRMSLSYESTGMENLYYYISDGDDIEQLNDFHLTIRTDFEDFDFPSYMMSPVSKVKNGEGWDLVWDLDNAVTGKDLGLIIPNRLNPGEIVSRVTFFAPVPLLFFFTVLIIFSALMKCPFHPMHYFFLAASFFSFHLMYSYFSDHMNLYVTFALSSLISLLLTVTYLRLFAPPKIAYLLAPLTQIIYLVLFSYSFFFDGMTGLILTICSVVTLFVLMQVTGRVEWDDLLGDQNNRRNGNKKKETVGKSHLLSPKEKARNNSQENDS